jgi:transcriptional regulator with XRE-family HTH domain
MTTFSANLIKARKKLNLTQEKISDSIGINQSTYQEWEKGRSPKIEYLPKLKEILGLTSIDDLFMELPSYAH